MEKASVDGKIISEWFIFQSVAHPIVWLHKKSKVQVKWTNLWLFLWCVYCVFLDMNYCCMENSCLKIKYQRKHHNKGLDKHEGDSIWIFVNFFNESRMHTSTTKNRNSTIKYNRIINIYIYIYKYMYKLHIFNILEQQVKCKNTSIIINNYLIILNGSHLVHQTKSPGALSWKT